MKFIFAVLFFLAESCFCANGETGDGVNYHKADAKGAGLRNSVSKKLLRIEHWYNIDVEINGSITADLRLRATVIDEDLEEVLGLLKRSLAIEYRIENSSLRSDETYAKKKVIISYKSNWKLI